MTDSALSQALALYRAGDVAGAERMLLGALQASPRDFDALHLMGGVLGSKGDSAGALKAFDAALAINAASAQAQSNRANLLLRMGRHAEAAAGYGAALALARDNAELWHKRGYALANTGDYDEALVSFDEALRLRSDDTDLICDRAAVLQALGRAAEAETELDRALERAPGHPTAMRARTVLRYNEGVRLLREGDYVRGFALYEARRAAGAMNTPALDRGRPPWSGDPLDGTLHVWAEMGLGEQVMFSRLIPLAQARAARVVLECDRRLMPLMQRSFDIDVRDAERGDAIEAQAQCALASLPHALQIAATDLGGNPFMRVDLTRTRAIRARYEAQGKPMVGIAWSSKNAVLGAEKSSRLTDWARLLREDYCFVNLQYGDIAAELAEAERAFGCTIHRDPEIDQMRDVDGFAAQIAALDAIVSVSNTTVHIAGAVGARCFVLLPPARRLLWYWGDSGEMTPWYDTLRLVAREPGETGWDGQVAFAAALLRDGLTS